MNVIYGDLINKYKIFMKFNKAASLLLPIVLCTQVSAQNKPDAGALRQQIDATRNQSLPPAVEPETSPLPPALQAIDGVTVQVEQFDIQGNTRFSTADLQILLKPWLSRPLDFSQLQAAAAAVAARYRQDGWVVRAYLPTQEIDQGVVTIRVVESLLGELHFEGEPSQRVSHAQLIRILLAQQAKGQALNAEHLDRGFLIANDLSGVNLSSVMQSGEQAQTTDVVINVEDLARTSVELTFDNTGAISTGANRAILIGEIRSPSGRGDLLSTQVLHSEGSDYMRLAYTLPWGDRGWHVGANVSNLQYQLVSADMLALDAKGHSASVGLEASYPLVRSRQRNLRLNLSAEAKNFYNQANGSVSSNYKAGNLALGLNGNQYDNWGGGGATVLGLNGVWGRINLEGSPNQADDWSTSHTDGTYAKLVYNASREQVLTSRLSAFASLRGQTANKNLDSSEKIYLGGMGSVRAYPTNEAGGSEGQLVNLELRSQLPYGLSLTGFYDWGQVKVNHDNNYDGAPTKNRLTLQGAGLSLGWQSTSKVNLRATWARRVGSNPNPTTAGLDQDGTLHMNRYWLSASVSF